MATNNVQNAVHTGARKRQQFRDTRNGVLPNSIDAFSRLTLDAGMKSALTQAGAKLTVEIDATGTRVFLADHRNGELIGGPEDLAKLGSIRAFVTRERKETAGVEVAKEISQLAFKAAKRLEIDEPGYAQASLDSSYGAAVRPLLVVLDRLVENEKKLDSNTNPELAEIFKPVLKNFFGRTREAYCKQILAITKGENTRGLLEENLAKLVVPQWVHAKIIVPGMVLERNQELARVLFPSDPSKGLTLTLKEWRHPVLRHNLGLQLLGNSQIALAFANNDKLLKVLCKLDPGLDLSDEANPSVAKLLKCRLAVMPPMRDSRYVTEPGSKAKGGWKFPSPAMESIQGAISSLSTALLRVYSANLQSVDLVGDFYATIVPGAVSRDSVTPTNNFYVQWSKADLPSDLFYQHLRMEGDGQTRVNMWRWLRTEMRLSEKAEGGKTLAVALNLTEEGKENSTVYSTVKVKVEEPDPKDQTKMVVVEKDAQIYGRPRLLSVKDNAFTGSGPTGTRNLLRKLTPVEESQAKEFMGSFFPGKDRKKKVVASGNNLSKLTPQGQDLVDEVKKLSPHLSERIKVWLRSFSDARLQRAAVKLTNASFDELFLQDGESEDESDGDEASDDGVGV